MDDVAARAGVSRSLVSLVMNDSPKVSPIRRAAVRAAAEDLGYAPHTLARELARHGSSVLAVLINDLHNPYVADLVEGIEDGGGGAGLRTILLSGGRDRAAEERAVAAMLGFRPAGVILLSPMAPSAVLRRAARQAPTVVVGRGVRLDEVDSIVDDGHAGSGLAVDHLVGLGHQAIVHLDGGHEVGATVRRRGFLAAMARHGLIGTGAAVEPSDYTEEAGAAAITRLLRGGHRFTAVVAANDINAIGAIGALEDAGRSVPQDVSVVGYDNTRLAALRHIGLTTIDQPCQRMGRMAVECVLRRQSSPRAPARHERLDPTLVVRTTTAPPPRGTHGSTSAQPGNASA
jgi:DNA-binding LacI/PurR family transcriptional regulator